MLAICTKNQDHLAIEVPAALVEVLFMIQHKITITYFLKPIFIF